MHIRSKINAKNSGEIHVGFISRLSRVISDKTLAKKSEKYWKMLGPGLTTGAADDDPSGVTTYSQTGARYGYQLLWLSAFTFPLMAIVQEMCARIGLVTDRGLAANIRRHFPRWALYVCTTLLFAANTFNIGADLGAMAKAVQLLVPNLHFGILVIVFAVVSLLLQIFETYERYAKYLKWLAFLLLSYVVTALMIDLDWGAVFTHTFIPMFDATREQLLLITGILGTTISPYLFFWQTSQEVEEEILDGRRRLKDRAGASVDEVHRMRVDVWIGMFLSNLVMFFIIATCAGTLFANGITSVTTAADAAAALRPLAGDAAYLLFAVGIIGTGLLGIPVLAGSASYALAETFKWSEGLNKKLKNASAFYGVMIVSMTLGLILNFVNIDPIRALLYAAVANGLVAPVVLVFIVVLASDKKIMGTWANRRLTTLFGWLIALVMGVIGIMTIVSLLSA